jgi:primosomal protein N'
MECSDNTLLSIVEAENNVNVHVARSVHHGTSCENFNYMTEALARIEKVTGNDLKSVYESRVNEEAKEQIVNLSKQVSLTDEQQSAADILVRKVDNGFSATLLDGVTGSGKTEVYFEAVSETLAKGKQVLVLVPEISLTSQWLKRFENRFGVTPFIWHSEISLKEKAKTCISCCGL